MISETGQNVQSLVETELKPEQELVTVPFLPRVMLTVWDRLPKPDHANLENAQV